MMRFNKPVFYFKAQLISKKGMYPRGPYGETGCSPHCPYLEVIWGFRMPKPLIFINQ